MWRKRELSDVYSHKPPNRMRSGPYPMTSFNLNYFLNGPIPNAATLRVKASTYEFWGDANIWSITQTITVIQVKGDEGMNGVVAMGRRGRGRGRETGRGRQREEEGGGGREGEGKSLLNSTSNCCRKGFRLPL